MSNDEQIKKFVQGIKRPQNVSYSIWPEFDWLQAKFTKIRQWFGSRLTKKLNLSKPDHYSELEWAIIRCTANTLQVAVEQVNLDTAIPSHQVRPIAITVCFEVNRPFIIRGLSTEQTVRTLVTAFETGQ